MIGVDFIFLALKKYSDLIGFRRAFGCDCGHYFFGEREEEAIIK